MNNKNLENLDILDNVDLSKTNNSLENSECNFSEMDYSNLFESDIETIDISTLLKSDKINTSESDNSITKSESIETSNDSIVKSESIEVSNDLTVKSETIEKSNDSIVKTESNNILETEKLINKDDNINPIKKIIKKRNNLYVGSIFLLKYLLTSSFIFALLLVTTNYSAYVSVAKSYIFKGELETKEQKLISSVEASVIKEKYSEDKNKENESNIEDTELSIKKMKKTQDKENIDLNIDITPYENRIVIPKIGKNVPLVDIKNRNVDGQKELNNIFMKELENGVVRYPGSALPGKIGTSFIFGHSSNYPWIKGEYNDVFALLDKVTYDDEIVVYYGQEKYVYKISEKKVITPGDVSVLERNKNKSEITIMTCWPIGTTLNRLIVVGELVEKK